MEVFKGYLPLIDTKLNPLRDIDESNQNSEKHYEYVDEDSKPLHYLGQLKRINIFVGANNSGKSRLMRSIFQHRHYNIFPNKDTWNTFRTEINDLLKNIKSNNTIHGSDKQNYLIIIEDVLTSIENLLKENTPTRQTSIINSLENIKNKTGFTVEQISELAELQCFSPQTIYIPILRSALTFYEDEYINIENDPHSKKNIYSKDIFKHTFGHLYKFEPEAQDDIFTGRNLYNEIKSLLLNRNDKRTLFKNFEDFISKAFFDGKQISITPFEETQRLEVYFGDGGKDNELHHLGDGIQAIMILAYKLFTAEQGAWVFIEEPEINLHPAYQRIFLNLLTENEIIKQKNLVVFFTTHSNHLLDLTITEAYKDDIAIFLFNKVDKIRKSVRQVNTQDLKLLDALGVHNSSVFMANCSIWVEGISDRIYIRNYLKALFEECSRNEKLKNEIGFEKVFKEDLHYCFFEYAGTNLAHYTFDDSNTDRSNINSHFLANRIMVIADKDKGKEGKHEKLKKELGNNNYIKLEVREIENLWQGEYLKKKLPNVFKKIKRTKLKTITFNELDDDFKNEYLRHYISEILNDWNQNHKEDEKKQINIPSAINTRKQDKQTNNVTIKKASFKPEDKPKLANETKDIKWENMSEKAQNLIIRIYKFIKEHNPE